VRCSPTRLARAEAEFRAENALPIREQNPLRVYQAICAIVKSSRFQVPGSRPADEPPPVEHRKEAHEDKPV